MTPLLFVCYTVQHRVVDIFFFYLYHIQYNLFPYLCVCFYRSAVVYLFLLCSICLMMAYCGSKRHSLQAVELSHRSQTAVQIVSNLPARFPFLGKPAIRTAGWMALLLTKAGDVETNPGPTTSHT